MERHDDRVIVRADASAKSALSRRMECEVQTIDHDIANEQNFARRFSLTTQCLIRIERRRKKQIGQTISHDTINLFWHRPVVTAEPRFDVRQR
jgi:hypothetical protein